MSRYISSDLIKDYLSLTVGWDKARDEILRAIDHKSDPTTDRFFYCDQGLCHPMSGPVLLVLKKTFP